MPHRPLALQRFHETHTADGYICWYKYVTDVSKAQILTDGHFNDSVEMLQAGDIVEAIVDAGDTPELVILRIDVATIGQDVETSDLTPAAA